MRLKIKTLIILSTFPLVFAACQSSERLSNSPNVQTSPSVSPTAAAPVSPASNEANSANAGGTEKTTANQNAKPSPTATAPVKPSASPTAAASKYKNYTARGVIKAIDVGNSSVTIDHEDIGDYMVGMEMPFPVVSKSILNNLKVGDKITFVLETGVGVERIISIRKN